MTQLSLDGPGTPGGLARAELMTAREVAALLEVPISTVLEWGRNGTLPRVKLGRRVRFIPSACRGGDPRPITAAAAVKAPPLDRGERGARIALTSLRERSAYVFGGAGRGAGDDPPRPSSIPIEVDGVLI